MKKKIIITTIIIILMGIIGLLAFFVNPKIYLNNKKLKEAITKIETDGEYQKSLGEIIPFDFDTLYTFDQYTSKEDIEVIIGFKSNYIKESTSEGMVQLLFVKDNKVVSSVCDYSVNLGYKIINFGNRATKETIFNVYTENRIKILDGNLEQKEEPKEFIDFEEESTEEIEETKETEEVTKPKNIKTLKDADETVDEQKDKEVTIEEENEKDKEIKETEENKDSKNVEIIEENQEETNEPEIIIITSSDTTQDIPKATDIAGNVVNEDLEKGIIHTYHLLDDGTYMCDGVIYKYVLEFDEYVNVDDFCHFKVLTNNKNLTSTEAYNQYYTNNQVIENSIMVEITNN